MGISRWHICVAVNCAFVFPCLLAKTFSINEAIAAESKRRLPFETTPQPKVRETGVDILSFLKSLRPDGLKWKIPRLSDNKLFKARSFSPLQYRKAFEIRSPFKPKNLNIFQKPRYKRKHHTIYEDTKNEKFSERYFPLLKNIRILFYNLFGPDTSSFAEGDRHAENRRKYVTKRNDGTCRCNGKSEDGNASPEAKSATNILSTDISLENSDTSTSVEPTRTPANHPAIPNFSSIRKNKILSILLARNTSSSWRDYNGLGKRSSSSFHRRPKGNIARNYGADEHITAIRRNETHKETHDENAHRIGRDDANRYGFRRGGHALQIASRTRPSAYNEDYETAPPKNAVGGIGRNIKQSKETDKLNVWRNKAEGPRSVRKFVRRLRESIPKDKSHNTEPIQSKEIDEKSDFDVTLNSTSDQRILDRNGTFPQEGKDFHPTNETITLTNDLYTDRNGTYLEEIKYFHPTNKTVILINDLLTDKNGTYMEESKDFDLTNETGTLISDLYIDQNGTFPEKSKDFHQVNETEKLINDLYNIDSLQVNPKNKTFHGYVMIIDGYSITRDKDGKNQLAKNTIRILS